MTVKELRKKLAAIVDKEGKGAESYPVVMDTITIEDVVDIEVRDIVHFKKESNRKEVEMSVRAVVLS